MPVMAEAIIIASLLLILGLSLLGFRPLIVKAIGGALALLMLRFFFHLLTG